MTTGTGDGESIDRRLIGAAETIEAGLGAESNASRLLREAAATLGEMRSALERADRWAEAMTPVGDTDAERTIAGGMAGMRRQIAAALARARGGGS